MAKRYTFSELEQLWVNAGGPKGIAPIMAAIALAESGGNPNAHNPSGATGLWQVLGAVHPADQSRLTDPSVNAHEAVLKWQTQGLGAWTTYTQGTYKQFLQGGPSPGRFGEAGPPQTSANQAGATAGKGGVSAVPDPTGNVVTDAGGFFQGLLGDLPGAPLLGEMFSAVGDVSHLAALVIDRFFQLFRPGQGYRLLFWGLTGVFGFGAYKAFTTQGPNGQSHLPIAIAFTGGAMLTGYMAFRPWPINSGSQPIKPGAYAFEVITGQPPAAGPSGISPTEVQITEGAIDTIVGLWMVQKAANTLDDTAQAIQSAKNTIFGWWGNLF